MIITKFILLTILFFSSFLPDVKSKNYDSMRFTCADEIGPLLEFKIPDLQVGKSKNLKIKTFDKIKRESSTVIEGVIKKLIEKDGSIIQSSASDLKGFKSMHAEARCRSR